MSLLSSGAAEPYRRLAEVFHDVLSEESPTALLERIADTLTDLIPYDDVHIYEADEAKRELIPVLVRSKWESEVMAATLSFGQGITGWAVDHREPVLSNRAHLDPRVRIVPGTPNDPEALVTVPLIARGRLKGTLNVYRVCLHPDGLACPRCGARDSLGVHRRHRAPAHEAHLPLIVVDAGEAAARPGAHSGRRRGQPGRALTARRVPGCRGHGRGFRARGARYPRPSPAGR